jgi:tetratricopeptide (TPR) repeat protein/ABC-type thiamine transport system ATPase subunit
LGQLCLPLSTASTDARTGAAEEGQELVGEAAQIERVLRQTAGNVARAARLLGISRGTLRHRMARSGVAKPGEILVSPPMGRLVESWCELRVRDDLLVSGPPGQTDAYSVVGLRLPGSPMEMDGRRPLSRFIGRQRELAMLEDLLARAWQGAGQVVGIIGEPGVGKSRLCHELISAHLAPGWLILQTSAVSYGQTIPYLLVIDLLKSYLQIASDDDESTLRHKAADKLRALGQPSESSLPALLTLLNVTVEDAVWHALEPPQRRRRIQDAIKRLLVQASQPQPILLVAENLHGIDDESQALLDTLIEGLATTRLLLLVTYRPEYHHRWGNKTYYTQLRLDPLPREHAQALIEALLGDDASLAPLTQSLWQRTAGNPFFLEESVQTLVDTRALAGMRGAYRLANPLQRIRVPATVQAVLAARIDRLPPQEKRLLQTAAVIGTEVPFALLQAVTDLPEEELRGRLTRLQSVEFLYEARLFPDLEHTFKHALTHEVAYGSLAQQQRQVLHRRLVDALEALYADRLVEQVERLAYHALRGEVWDKALLYSRQSGEKALMRSAHREAAGSFEQALIALSHLPDQRPTREQAIDLRLALRTAVYLAGDMERVMALLQEVEALATALGDPRRLGQVMFALTSSLYLKGAYDQTIAAAQRALDLSTASGDASLPARANQALGWAYEALGDYRQAIDCFGRTVAALAGAWRQERFGLTTLPAVNALTCLARCHGQMGTFAAGVALGDEGLLIAEAVAHPASLLFASCSVGSLCLRQGDLPRALPLLERAMNICYEADLPFYFPWVAATLGEAYTLCGRLADATPLLTQSMAQSMAMGSPHWEAFFLLPLGEAYALTSRLEEAYTLTHQTLTLAQRYQQRGNQASALRLLGEVVARRAPPKGELAASYYRQALSLAEALGMRPLQAHCHRGLGALYA